jgi:hypothetical protein
MKEAGRKNGASNFGRNLRNFGRFHCRKPNNTVLNTLSCRPFRPVLYGTSLAERALGSQRLGTSMA